MFGNGRRQVRRVRGASHLALLLAAAACTKGVEPSITACTAAGDSVSLAVNGYGFFDPSVAQGCTVFPATVNPAEYLVVPQLTAGNPGDQAQYRLGGDTVNVVTPSPTAEQLRSLSPTERFHLFLRLGDERRWWGFAPEVGPQPSPPQPAPQVGKPTYGELRTFQV